MDEKPPPSAEPGQNGTDGLSSQTGHPPQQQHEYVLVPPKTARSFGVIIDDQLTFTAHIASVSRSCRFALYNIRKFRPYLTQYATQLLVQTLVNSRLDYCNALLTGLPACVVKRWFSSHLPKCSCQGQCYTQDAALF